MPAPLEDSDLEKARGEARDALLKYDRLLTAETRTPRSVSESSLLAEGLVDDARRLVSSPYADLRESGLHLVALLPPASQAYLFSTLGRNLDAKKAFARFVDAERCLLVGESIRSARIRDLLPEAMLDAVRENVDRANTERGQWESRLFEALDSADRDELNELLGELGQPSGAPRSRYSR